MSDGILDWTNMDICAPQMQASAGTPNFIILGGNTRKGYAASVQQQSCQRLRSKFRQRQGFAAGKTLVRRKSAGAWRSMGGIACLTEF